MHVGVSQVLFVMVVLVTLVIIGRVQRRTGSSDSHVLDVAGTLVATISGLAALWIAGWWFFVWSDAKPYHRMEDALNSILPNVWGVLLLFLIIAGGSIVIFAMVFTLMLRLWHNVLVSRRRTRNR